jgi:hypothetical protein
MWFSHAKRHVTLLENKLEDFFYNPIEKFWIKILSNYLSKFSQIRAIDC